jgi:hypothetical protein
METMPLSSLLLDARRSTVSATRASSATGVGGSATGGAAERVQRRNFHVISTDSPRTLRGLSVETTSAQRGAILKKGGQGVPLPMQ